MESNGLENFQLYYNRLNRRQKEAVDLIEGTVMVIAGPGTGKTEVLTLRIANILLKTQINPENILALTFSESGVAAMRKRLISIIGPTAYRVNIFTFHGFSNYLIQTNPDYFPEFTSAVAITELEQIQIIESIFQSLHLDHIKPLGEIKTYVRPSMSSITELKRENITPQDFEKILEKWRQDYNLIDDLYHEKGRYQGKLKTKYVQELKEIEKNYELLQVYENYQKILTAKKLYDFEDMLLVVIEKMKNNENFLLDIQERFQYILVDEHQDTNRAQNKIVELISSFHSTPNLFVVGDEKQAIYRFQGASLSNFLYLKKVYPHAVLISLSENYRSSQMILDAAHDVISYNQVPKEADLPSRIRLQSLAKQPNNKIEIYEVPDTLAEYYFIAQKIKELVQNGHNLSEIAVLGRANADLINFMPVLAKFEIAFVLEAKQNIFEDRSVQALIIILKAVEDLNSDEKLLKALHLSIFGIHPRDLILIHRQAVESDKSLWQVMDDLDNLEADIKDRVKVKNIYDQFCHWHSLSKNEILDHVFTSVLNQSGLLQQVLRTPNLLQGLDKLIVLYHELRLKLSRNPTLTLSDFLDFIQLLEFHHLSIETKINSKNQNSVRLMTAHGSKGQEFNIVFILNCFDKKWGNSSSHGARFKLPYVYFDNIALSPDDPNADERRLFFVALTRAKSQIIITYPKKSIEGKDIFPSQFIFEITQELREKNDDENFSNWYQNNRHIILSNESKAINRDISELKELVREIFTSGSLSVSALNNYLACPWKYFFRNLVLLPESKTPALIYGSAVHFTLNQYINQRKIKVCDKNWIEETFKTYFNSQSLSQAEYRQYIKKGLDNLNRFIPDKMSLFPDNTLSELKINNVYLNEIKLSGKLDLVEFINEQNVRVYDFKTGGYKSRNEIEGKTQKSNGDYKRQLIFYKLLLDKYHGGKFQMKEGVIQFVESNNWGNFRQESFVITDEEIQELKSTIYDMSENVQNLNFWESRCNDKNCRYCSLRDLMD